MIMELPKSFRMPYAEVIKGELLIYENVRFEDLMYEITYASKKRICKYCGEHLSKTTSTMDYGYPRATGGISIPNNLFPCCSECNPKKGEMTHDEYLHFLKLEEFEKKKYRQELLKAREDIFHKKGFKLPKKWITMTPLILIDYKPASRDLKGKRYYRISEFYQKYQELPRPIIVDKNMRLLDGYNCIVFKKDHNLKRIPTIILENVVLY